MSYRPITDMWILARAKLNPHEDGTPRKYYGAYLGGFPERARGLLSATIREPVLHVCGGHSKHYPYKGGFGVHDQTLDLAEETKPDFLQDANDPFPTHSVGGYNRFKAYLMDPPYSEEDAEHYDPGAAKYPKPNTLVNNAMEALEVGGRVGIIHYLIPKCPKGCKFIACIGVMCGFNNRIRAYSVYEKQ